MAGKLLIFAHKFLKLELGPLFLPVEHRSYNRDFKISSKILIPPQPPIPHLPTPTPEIIWKFFIKHVLPTKQGAVSFLNIF